MFCCDGRRTRYSSRVLSCLFAGAVARGRRFDRLQYCSFCINYLFACCTLSRRTQVVVSERSIGRSIYHLPLSECCLRYPADLDVFRNSLNTCRERPPTLQYESMYIIHLTTAPLNYEFDKVPFVS